VVSADGRKLDPSALPPLPRPSLQTGRLDLNTTGPCSPERLQWPPRSPGPGAPPVGDMAVEACCWRISFVNVQVPKRPIDAAQRPARDALMAVGPSWWGYGFVYVE